MPVRATRGPELGGGELLACAEHGQPLRTIWGPPPIAATTPGQPGRSWRRTVTSAPGSASSTSASARRAPREQHSAARRDLDRGAACPHLTDNGTEVEVRHRLGKREEHDHRRAGNERRGWAVGVGEQPDLARLGHLVERRDGVLRARALPGAEERDLAPMSSRPSLVMPALERALRGGLTRTPSRMRTPLGRPVASVKKSPFTPAVTAEEARRFCIAVSRLATEQRLVREQRLERGDAAGARPAEDRDRDRAIRRELHAPLVGDPGPEHPLLVRRPGRRADRARRARRR